MKRKNTSESLEKSADYDGRFYKGRYMIALCDDEELIRYLFDNTDQMAKALGKKRGNVASMVSKLESGEISRMKVGWEWMTLELLPADEDEEEEKESKETEKPKSGE